jgi:uncharacterized protein (DUF58 family)
MISPTPKAVWLMAAGFPLMLLIGILVPGLWGLAAAWIMIVLGLLLADTMIAAKLTAFKADLTPPAMLYIGSEDPAQLSVSFGNGPLPDRVQVKLDTGELLKPVPPKGLRGWNGRTHSLDLLLIPIRRGEADLIALWARWQGPLGLVRKQIRQDLSLTVPVLPNSRWVKQEAVRLYTRDADFGIKQQLHKGDGSEFDALREFAAGMDRRAIDWKQSARHRNLLAKEFRTERNHNIVFAFDTGRLMSEPLDGMPKLDRAINAALLLAFVSLRAGDRTALYGFDAQPVLSSNLLHGTAAFTQAQALASTLDYSANDANYTLALTDLSGKLKRRSLIILFTDFVDTVSSELMLETLTRLTKRHVVLFATFKDAALESLLDAPPETPEDISRAVVADTLLDERKLVFRRLQRLGVQIIETTPDRFGSQLVSRYLDIKGRDLL